MPVDYSKETPLPHRFWESIIEPTVDSASIAGGDTVYLTIQPPSGETWLVFVNAIILHYVNGSYIIAYYTDGTTDEEIQGDFCDASRVKYPCLQLTAVITNTKYLKFEFYNADSVGTKRVLMYSGFKL